MFVVRSSFFSIVCIYIMICGCGCIVVGIAVEVGIDVVGGVVGWDWDLYLY